MAEEVPSNMIFIIFITFINDLDQKNMIQGGKKFGCHGNHSCGTIFALILEHRYLSDPLKFLLHLFLN